MLTTVRGIGVQSSHLVWMEDGRAGIAFEQPLHAAVYDYVMDAQGNFTMKLMRDWVSIVGSEAAKTIQPKKVVFPHTEATGGVLHINVAPEIAPELQYRQEAIIEQIARYTGFKAIERIILHPDHSLSK